MNNNTEGNNTEGNNIAQKFLKCCLRVGAAAIALPTELAGVGVAIVGGVAAVGLFVPALIISSAVSIATNNTDA